MKKLVVVLLLLLLAAAPAMAKSVITFPPGYGQDDFNKLSVDAGVAMSYTPLAPAEPLGLVGSKDQRPAPVRPVEPPGALDVARAFVIWTRLPFSAHQLHRVRELCLFAAHCRE